MARAFSRWDRQQRQTLLHRRGLFPPKVGIFSSRRKLWIFLLIGLAIVAILPPIYFHFILRRLEQMQLRKCSWIKEPPLVCAHGGDSTKAFPNTLGLEAVLMKLKKLISSRNSILKEVNWSEDLSLLVGVEGNDRYLCYLLMDAYKNALSSQVECIEIDVSRSSDGVLFALHDRDLQRISGNTTSNVGYFSEKEIAGLGNNHQHLLEFDDVKIPTIEDALKLVSSSVRQVILDAKVGPPLYEKGLASDIVSIVQRTKCNNCIIWAKSDTLVRDLIRLSINTMVGYIVMTDPSTRTRMKLLRMKDAGVVGVYYPLIDEKLVKILHGNNKKVYAWTVDKEESMEKMLSERVDAVITSYPVLLQRVMQDTRKQCFQQGFSLAS